MRSVLCALCTLLVSSPNNSDATFPWLAHTNNITLFLFPICSAATKLHSFIWCGDKTAVALWQPCCWLWPLIRPRYRNSFPHKIQLGNWFSAKQNKESLLFFFIHQIATKSIIKFWLKSNNEKRRKNSPKSMFSLHSLWNRDFQKLFCQFSK